MDKVLFVVFIYDVYRDEIRASQYITYSDLKFEVVGFSASKASSLYITHELKSPEDFKNRAAEVAMSQINWFNWNMRPFHSRILARIDEL